VYDEMNESALLDGALQFYDLECDGKEFSLIKDMWSTAEKLSSDGNLDIGIPPPPLSFVRREEEQADMYFDAEYYCNETHATLTHCLRRENQIHYCTRHGFLYEDDEDDSFQPFHELTVGSTLWLA